MKKVFSEDDTYINFIRNKQAQREDKNQVKWRCPICKTRVPYRGCICTDCYLKRQDEIIEHENKLEKNRKYRNGETITTLKELLEQEIVMWFDRPRHIEVIKSLQLRTILKFLNKGYFEKAIKKEKKNERR